MKYIRKIASLVIALIFITAAAISAGIIFSVHNVNISLTAYSSEENRAEIAAKTVAQIKQSVLGVCYGSVITFVNEEDVASAVERQYDVDGVAMTFSLEGFEKIYPCTINLKVKERRATFAEELENGSFAVYDDSGKFLYNSENNLNSVDGGDNAPFVLLKGVTSDETRQTVAYLGGVFADDKNFASLRASVESIELVAPQSSIDKPRMLFVLRCGLSVEIHDCENLAEEKISAAAKEFRTLVGEQKLCGSIYCFAAADGLVSAVYNLV